MQSALAAGFLGLVSSMATSAAAQDEGAVSLFTDGLDGWHRVGGDARFVLEDGVLRGTGATGGNAFLVSDDEYRDFVLEAEVRIEPGGNSGIQFRSHVRDDGRLRGYQAEVDSTTRGWSGGIYDEGRRGWLAPLEGDRHEEARAAFRVGEWNRYRIEARGPLLRTWVNGVPCAELFDEEDAAGHLAFQVHGGDATDVRFRNVRLRELPPWSVRAGEARAALLEGVDVLPRHGVPGTIAVYGPHAAAVVTSGRAEPRALAAVAEYGQGRAFAIAHDGYLAAPRWEAAGGREGETPADSALAAAALRWVARDDGPLRIALLGDDARLAGALEARGHRVARRVAPDGLAGHDVVVMRGARPFAPGEARAIRAFVAHGGGLLSAACPWGWQQVHARRGWSLRDDLGDNQVLAPMGLCYAEGYADATAEDGFAVTASQPVAVHAGRIVDARAASADEPISTREGGVVAHAIRAVPAAADGFLERVEKGLGPPTAQEVPTPERPLRLEDDRDGTRVSMALAMRRWSEAPPEEIPVAPGAEAFPGTVPGGAERITVVHDLDPEGWRWQGGGHWVPAGEPVRVRVTAGDPRGWSIVIGAHRDALWHKPTWKRWPEISRKTQLRGETTLATPFGGLLHFERGDGAGPVAVEVTGVVEAPYFALEGDDSKGAWRRRRDAPAPWATLAGRHLAITLPSRAVRELDDPAAVMRFWDAVVEAHCELAGVPRRPHEERFVADVQISAGYMHAGFPIMMHLDVAEPREDRPAVLLDLDQLEEEGNWGCFHEVGHNFQRPEWTFSGTGEVTCNLFSLHAGDLLCGIEPWENPWLEKQKPAGRRYLDEGADFGQWQRRPGVALLVYAQVQREFGWEPFREVLAGYRALAPAERPRSDAAKRDAWVRRLSMATGRDLRPLHAAWGWPLGEALLEDGELDGLRSWMPDLDEL